MGPLKYLIAIITFVSVKVCSQAPHVSLTSTVNISFMRQSSDTRKKGMFLSRAAM